MSANIYVDGFNLYYGCLRGTPYKWLDLAALCRRLFPRDTIHRIRYFTANITPRPSGPPQKVQRQQAYLRALQTIPHLTIHRGRYLTHPTRMPLAHPRPGGPTTVEVIKTAEKGSDVNLATYLLLDTYDRSAYRGALVLAAALLWINDFKASPAPGSTAARPLRAAQLHPGSAGRRTSADTLG